MNLYALSVNHRANPLGINSDEQPYFGWKLKSEKPNTMQAAYRLRIYADDTVCFDSGRVETACNAFGLRSRSSATANILPLGSDCMG